MSGCARELNEHAKVAVGLEPLGLDRLYRRQIDRASVDLAALHGEKNRGGIGIAYHLLDVQSYRIAQDDRHVVAGRSFGRGAEHERRKVGAARLLDRFHRRVLAHEQNIGVVGEARCGAEPRQPARVKLHVGVAAEETEERHVARERADRGAVLRRDVVEIVDRAQAAGTRHILHDHGWMSGNKLAEVARKQPRMDIVAATRAIADDQVYLPALVEVGERIRMRRDDRQCRGDYCRRTRARKHASSRCKANRAHRRIQWCLARLLRSPNMASALRWQIFSMSALGRSSDSMTAIVARM